MLNNNNNNTFTCMHHNITKRRVLKILYIGRSIVRNANIGSITIKGFTSVLPLLQSLSLAINIKQSVVLFLFSISSQFLFISIPINQPRGEQQGNNESEQQHWPQHQLASVSYSSTHLN